MKGYEAFKVAREATGYSHREFAAIAGISLGALICYENGKMSLLTIPVKKAIKMFDNLNISLHDFYMTYYFEELDVNDAVCEWRKNNPREYSVKKLYKRFKSRIFKYKEREQISQESFEYILDRMREIFNMPVMKKDFISDELYEKYILTLNVEINKCLEENLSEEEKEKSKVTLMINKYISNTDYCYKDISQFIGVAYRGFLTRKNTENGLDNMQVNNVLRMCNVFSVRFEEIFGC